MRGDSRRIYIDPEMLITTPDSADNTQIPTRDQNEAIKSNLGVYGTPE